MKKSCAWAFALASLGGAGMAGSETVTGKIVIDGVEIGGSAVIRGDQRPAREERKLACFDRIRVGASIDLIYRPGERCTAQVEADANLLPLIETHVAGNHLEIGVNQSLQSAGALRVAVSSPRLEAITVEGAATVHLFGIDSPRLQVKLAGSGEISGEGRTDLLQAEASGSADLDFSRLEARDARIRASGAANVTVNVRQTLQANAAGAGTIVYYGQPSQVDKRISGAGDVEAAD